MTIRIKSDLETRLLNLQQNAGSISDEEINQVIFLKDDIWKYVEDSDFAEQNIIMSIAVAISAEGVKIYSERQNQRETSLNNNRVQQIKNLDFKESKVNGNNNIDENIPNQLKILEEIRKRNLEEDSLMALAIDRSLLEQEQEQRHEVGSDSNFIETHPMLSTVFAGMAIGATLSSVVVGASIGGFFGAGVYFCVKSLVDYCKKPEFHEEGIEILPCEPQNQNAARAFTDEPQNVARAFNDDKKLDDSGNEVFPTIEMQSTEESFINDKKTNLLVKCIFTGNHIPIEEAIQIDGQWYSIEYFTHEALSIIDGKNPFAIINPITKKEFEKDDLEKIAIYYNTTVENIKKIMNISYIKRTKIYKSLKNEVITANKARNYDKKNDIKEKNHKKQGEEPGAYFKRIKEIIDFDDYEKEEDLIIEARKCHFDKMSEERNKA